ncbi:hypothetical protein SLEP1_g12669 [Rubroshorea leprosula]|uniref:Uncharacterized protein n=1 Tax=Rubroshorea leprosula TaxID=152421 RepID=A0AAV5IHR4_9ROSI|nr:hypothetical protein SLEP1_g12669 [Rubroshorea leprosula]
MRTHRGINLHRRKNSISLALRVLARRQEGKKQVYRT